MDIRDNGSVDGDIIAPRVAIAEGAHFRGSVDMQRGGRAAGDEGRRQGGRGAEAPSRRQPAPPKPPQPGVAPSANPGAQKVGV